jgi:heme exporter protein C
VPLNFIAVRLSQSLIHPRVLTATGDNLPSEMRLTFYVAVITAVLLFVALWKFELVAKSVSMQVKKLNRSTA